jgi:hypothetical protein
MKGLIIRTTGEIEFADFEHGNSYNTIKEAVAGWIECVHLPSLGADLWVNEEGKLIGLPINAHGTKLWAKEYGRTDIIVGDIIITGGADEEGDTLGITPTQLAGVLANLKSVN